MSYSYLKSHAVWALYLSHTNEIEKTGGKGGCSTPPPRPLWVNQGRIPPLIKNVYFRINDSSGLFGLCESKIEWFRVLVAAPPDFNTVLFGGLLGSVFSMLQFMASPIIGGFSDRYLVLK